jgi:hypothetical protein
VKNPLIGLEPAKSIYRLLGFMARHPRGPAGTDDGREIARLTLQEIVSVTGAQVVNAQIALEVMAEARLLSSVKYPAMPTTHALKRTMLYKNIESHGWNDWGKTLAAVWDTNEGVARDTSGMPGAWELNHKKYIATTAGLEEGITTSVIAPYGESAYTVLSVIFPREST